MKKVLFVIDKLELKYFEFNNSIIAHVTNKKEEEPLKGASLLLFNKF